MDLELTDDQRMLKDMADRFVADRYGFEARQAILRSSAGWSRAMWEEMAGLGLLMIPVAERDGGMGGGGVELMIVGEALGRGLVVEPWLPMLLAATVIGRAGEDHRSGLLGSMMTGATMIALADEAQAVAANGRVSGSAAFVPGGAAADRLLVAAVDMAGVPRVVLIDPAGPGVSRTDFPLHGGGRAASVRFDEAPVLAELLAGADARSALAAARDIGIMAVTADALGAAQAAFDMTVDYLKTRVQFGQPIGANQALQHRAAEMFVELEQLRSAAIFAACTLGAGSGADEEERERAGAAVRFVTAKAARFVGQQAVQLHGGIGVTDEYAIGHYLLRLTAAAMLFGDGDRNVSRLAAAGGYVTATSYWDGA